MNLLVDGHNLIGQLPDISLADPDDEARLVLLLRGYAARKRRQVVVVFDHGVYGHPQSLDGYSVTCYFAKSPQDADTHLIRRIKSLSRPRDWALVSSDRQVTRVAEECGVRVFDAREFAGQLRAPAAPGRPPPDKPERQLSAAEVDEWLILFGEDPQAADSAPEPPAAPPPTPAPQSAKTTKSRRKRR